MPDLYQASPFLLAGLAAVFGLLCGSFFNVVIYRLPKQMEASWRQECRMLLEQSSETPEKFNLAFPNSHCPQCKQAVKPWHNIPVISYLLLRGKCASCKANIGLRYPLIEIFTALLAVAAVLYFGATPYTVAVIIVSWTLLILTVIDIDHQLLPDQLTLPLLWLGLAYHAVFTGIPLQDALWGAIFGYLILWLVYWGFKLLTGKEGMGYGDFKLLAALGAWLGWQQLPLIIVLSSLVGAVYGSLNLLLTKQDHSTPIPFGPYLAGAGLIAMYWGQEIIAAYLRFAGLA